MGLVWLVSVSIHLALCGTASGGDCEGCSSVPSSDTSLLQTKTLHKRLPSPGSGGHSDKTPSADVVLDVAAAAKTSAAAGASSSLSGDRPHATVANHATIKATLHGQHPDNNDNAEQHNPASIAAKAASSSSSPSLSSSSPSSSLRERSDSAAAAIIPSSLDQHPDEVNPSAAVGGAHEHGVPLQTGHASVATTVLSASDPLKSLSILLEAALVVFIPVFASARLWSALFSAGSDRDDDEVNEMSAENDDAESVLPKTDGKEGATKAEETNNFYGPRSADIKVIGMTCSACSSTVERGLLQEPGVSSASVSLIWERAHVVFDSKLNTAQALADAVEDLGFDSTLLSEAPVNEADCAISADLHLSTAKPITKSVQKVLEGLCYIHEVRLLDDKLLRVRYDPCQIGARTLLKTIREDYPDTAWTVVPPRLEEVSRVLELERKATSLWTCFRGSAIPAAAVFAITILLPAFGIDLGYIDCLKLHLHVATILVLLLASPVLFVFGADFHKQARKAMKRRAPNMDVLVSLATIISFSYATLVLLARACKVLSHPVPMGTSFFLHGDASMHHEDPMGLGLGCHALHFFGMAPILMSVVLCGKFIEVKANIQTMSNLVTLAEKKSAAAQVKHDNGEVETVAAELVHLGDTIKFAAGDILPVDGVQISSEPVLLSEAILTGESRPREKLEGHRLLAGTTVVRGSGEMLVQAIGSKTALGEIVALISTSQTAKTHTQQLANTVAGYFVTAVMLVSVIVFAIWLELTRRHLVTMPEDLDPASAVDRTLFAAKFAVAVLMVACPCAMGLATPTALMVSADVAASNGCLIKNAEGLEAGRRVRTLVLDKTGTLTQGTPSTHEVVLAMPCLRALSSRSIGQEPPQDVSHRPTTRHLVGGEDEVSSSEPPVSREELRFWQLVAAVEQAADHPLAHCLLLSAQKVLGAQDGPTSPSSSQKVSNFRSEVGRGVAATVGGVEVHVGSFSWFQETQKSKTSSEGSEDLLKPLETWASGRRAATDSVVVVFTVTASSASLLGAVAVRDTLREDSLAVVRHCQSKGIEVWMCTGDAQKTAFSVAKEAGIPEHCVCAEMLPKQKADKVAELKERKDARGTICFVGDGVNDAPALAAADVGLAIGASASLAKQAADVVLISGELTTVATFLKLSKETVHTIWRNYAWAFLFNVAGLPIAAGVFYPKVVLPPFLAGLAMALSSTFVVSSSLLLRYFSPPTLAC